MKRKKPSEIEWIPYFKYCNSEGRDSFFKSFKYTSSEDVNQEPTKGEKMRDVKKAALNRWRIYATKHGITNEKNRYLFVAGFIAASKV